MTKKFLLTTVLALAVTAPASAQQLVRGNGRGTAADLALRARSRQRIADRGKISPVEKWLNQNIESVSWDEELFEDVIRWARELPGEMNIIMDWHALEGAGVDREAPITLELRNLRLHVVLNLALRQAGGDEPLAYHGTDNILTITTEDERAQPRQFVIRIYNIVDLVRLTPDFINAPSIRLSNLQEKSSGQGGGGQQLFSDDDDDDEDGDDRVQKVMDMIIAVIEPSSWTVNGGFGTISAHNDILVVNNSLSVHEKLGGPVRTGEQRSR